MRKNVVNSIKMEEGEFHPNKDVPDILEDGSIMTTYWTVLGENVYTFVTLEKGSNGEILDAEDITENSRLFYLYGALHGKVYPWQIELADLSSRLQCVVKANSIASAQVKLFDKAEQVMETIAASQRENATVKDKVAAWKNLAYIESLFSREKLTSSWFCSRHAGTIERLLEGEELTKEEQKLLQCDFSKMSKARKLLRKVKSVAGESQISFWGDNGQVLV